MGCWARLDTPTGRWRTGVADAAAFPPILTCRMAGQLQPRCSSAAKCKSATPATCTAACICAHLAAYTYCASQCGDYMTRLQGPACLLLVSPSTASGPPSSSAPLSCPLQHWCQVPLPRCPLPSNCSARLPALPLPHCSFPRVYHSCLASATDISFRRARRRSTNKNPLKVHGSVL